MDEFVGASGAMAPTLDALPISLSVDAVVGDAETLLTRPSTSPPARALAIVVEAGSFRVRPGDYREKVFTADNTTDELTIAGGHDYSTGEGPLRLSVTGGTLPTGLAVDTDYWIIVVNATTFQLASSYDDALAGTAVSFSTDGTPTTNIGGMPDAPTVTSSDGYQSVNFSATEPQILAAADKMTVAGADASSKLVYWWLP